MAVEQIQVVALLKRRGAKAPVERHLLAVKVGNIMAAGQTMATEMAQEVRVTMVVALGVIMAVGADLHTLKI
jgi:hypothetical protein